MKKIFTLFAVSLFTATLCAECPAPTNLQLTNATDNSITVSWTAGGEETEWNLEYDLGTGWVSVTENPLTTTSYTFTEIVPYSFQVQSICGEEGAWSEVITFGAPSSLTLSAVTSSSATIRWSPVAGVSQYQYKLDDEEWSSENIIEATQVDLNNLLPNTDYTFYLRSYYSETAQSATISQDFTTDCVAKPLPFEEDFSEGIDCWTMINCHESTGADEGVFLFYQNSNPPQYLISPALISSGKQVKVEFLYKANNESLMESFEVGYSTTTSALISFTWGTEVKCTATEFGDPYSETLPSNTKYIAIKYTAKDKDGLIIDDFNVTAVEPTDINSVGADDAKAIKLIENDQLVIIRDGIKYNAQGKRLGE